MRNRRSHWALLVRPLAYRCVIFIFVSSQTNSQIEAARLQEVSHAAATEQQMRHARQVAADADEQHYKDVRDHGLVQGEEVPIPRSSLPAALAEGAAREGSPQPRGGSAMRGGSGATGTRLRPPAGHAGAGSGSMDALPSRIRGGGGGREALAAVSNGEALLASRLLDSEQENQLARSGNLTRG